MSASGSSKSTFGRAVKDRPAAVPASPGDPYSYHSDPAVPAFDDSAPLVIFDGHCVLCSRGVQWMMRHDPHGTSRFAAVQDPIAKALYLHYGLDPERFDTFMVLVDGVPYTRWAGILAAARTMPASWSWLGAMGRIVPDFIGDRIYDWVQRNRIGWFGAREACYRPEPREARRFALELTTPRE